MDRTTLPGSRWSTHDPIEDREQVSVMPGRTKRVPMIEFKP